MMTYSNIDNIPTAITVLIVMVYLFYALLRPDKF